MSRGGAPTSPLANALARPGLAGGIDCNGLDAARLLHSGFGAVEFGTVTLHPRAAGLERSNAGLAALCARLQATPRQADAARVGISFGSPPGLPAQQLADDWRAGWRLARSSCDYFSINLSARCCAAWLAPAARSALHRALLALVHERAHLGCSVDNGRDLPPELVVKIALGSTPDPLPYAALAAVEAGFAALTVVLPDTPDRLPRLRELAAAVAGRCLLIAVGGLHDAASVAAARAAGADGVQTHTAFRRQGYACIAALQAGLGPVRGQNG